MFENSNFTWREENGLPCLSYWIINGSFKLKLNKSDDGKFAIVVNELPKIVGLPNIDVAMNVAQKMYSDTISRGSVMFGENANLIQLETVFDSVLRESKDELMGKKSE